MVKPSHLSLLACRIVGISTKYGVSSETAFGLLTYSFCSIAIFRDIDEGYRWGNIALSLLQCLGAKKLVPRLETLCHQGELIPVFKCENLNFVKVLFGLTLFFFCDTKVIFFWVKPLQSSLNAFLRCHREALLVGDNESASFGARDYSALSISCGSYLPTVEKECTSLALKMVNELYFDHSSSSYDNNFIHRWCSHKCRHI